MGSDYNQEVGLEDDKVFALVAAAKARKKERKCRHSCGTTDFDMQIDLRVLINSCLFR